MSTLSTFREIVVADFEFEVGHGERPVPVCCVAHELRRVHTVSQREPFRHDVVFCWGICLALLIAAGLALQLA